MKKFLVIAALATAPILAQADFQDSMGDSGAMNSAGGKAATCKPGQVETFQVLNGNDGFETERVVCHGGTFVAVKRVTATACKNGKVTRMQLLNGNDSTYFAEYVCQNGVYKRIR
jgi:hypothetical protein